MARTVYLSSNDHHSPSVPTVYHKAQWQDAWTQTANLQAVSVTKTTGRTIGEAQLVFEYGLIQGQMDLTPQTVAPLSLRNQWVKIEWQPTTGGENYDFSWPTAATLPTTGIEDGQRALVEDENSVYVFNTGAWTDTGEGPTAGTETFYGICRDELVRELGDDSVLTGTQTFVVLSVEWLLSRQQLAQSKVRTPGQNYTDTVDLIADLPTPATEGDRTWVKETDTVWEYNSGAWSDTTHPPIHHRVISYAIPFNASVGHQASSLYGPANKEPDDLAFAEDLGNADEWNARRVLEYILTEFPPTDDQAPTWEVQGASAPQLEWEIPRDLALHGQNLFDIINLLVDRRRGLLWWVAVTEDADPAMERFSIVVESMLENDLTLPTGSTILKNSAQYNVNIISEPGVEALSRVISAQRKFQTIVIEGRPMGAWVSLELAKDPLPLWTDADKTAYETIDAEPSDNDATRRANNDRRRATDPKQRRVFTTFETSMWDGKFSNLSTDPMDKAMTFPKLDWNGDEITPLEQHETWWPGVRFLDVMPDVDKTESFVVVRDPEDDATMMPYKYLNMTQLNSFGNRETKNTAGAPFNSTLTMLREAAGFAISPSAVPHQIAKADFATPALLGSTDHQPELDWQTGIATVYAQFPDRARVEYPDPATRAPVHNAEDVHVIRIGDRGRLDYLAKDMILGLDSNQELNKVSTSAWINDDRPYMRDLAQTAYEWYRRDMQAIELTPNQISSLLPLGSLICEIFGTGSISSVVTSVEWDFQRFRTRIRTEFAEVDLTR